MTEKFAPIRRPFTEADLRPDLKSSGVEGTVLIQCWHSIEETMSFLETAERVDFVKGVVGWVDLTGPDVDGEISRLKAGPGGKYLVGVRHLVHDETDPDWLLRDDVRAGLAALERHNLAYDLLVRTRELPAAVKTVADFPGIRFVVDHIAKPEIGRHRFQPWAALMRGFASHRDHVWCKLSGMETEADWTNWKPSDLKPYVNEVLDIFHPERCVFGSNWPVCLMAASYGRVISALRENCAGLSKAEQDLIVGGSAVDLYRLRDFQTAMAASDIGQGVQR